MVVTGIERFEIAIESLLGVVVRKPVHMPTTFFPMSKLQSELRDEVLAPPLEVLHDLHDLAVSETRIHVQKYQA